MVGFFYSLYRCGVVRCLYWLCNGTDGKLPYRIRRLPLKLNLSPRKRAFLLSWPWVLPKAFFCPAEGTGGTGINGNGYHSTAQSAIVIRYDDVSHLCFTDNGFRHTDLVPAFLAFSARFSSIIIIILLKDNIYI